ncbi:MAG: ABC transporter ATP-binding protein [Pirellulaceae bacterium]
MSHIEIQAVSRKFGAVSAVTQVDLTVASGERMVLLGRSGAGKSTLLRIMAGLEPTDAGRVLIADRDVSSLSPSDRNVALVSQDYALYPQLTVQQNMQASLARQRLSGSARDARINEVLEWFQIAELRNRLPAQLSGGQAQRVAFAKAIVRRPQILLLDEPLSQIDALLRHEARSLIANMSGEFSVTIVMVTHDPLDALQIGTQLAIMDSGRIIQVDAPKQLYRQPHSKVAAELLSPFGVNWLSVADASTEFCNASTAPTGASLLGIRPEHIVRQSDDRALDTESWMRFSAHVESVCSLGFADLATARIGTAGSIKVLAPPHQLEVGSITFQIHPAHCLWL